MKKVDYSSTYTKIIKNPTFKEYFKIKETDGYVRGFYNTLNDDIWIWRGDMLHKYAFTILKLDYNICRFILETNSFRIKTIDEEFKPRVINKLKEFEPIAKEEKAKNFHIPVRRFE